MKPKLIRPSVFYFLLALTLGVVGFYFTSARRLAISIGAPAPTPKPTPKLIPKPPSTIDFDYQIIRVVGSSYSVSSDRNKTPIVISSRVELEDFYHSAYADVDIGTTNIREYIPHPDADAFWEAIEVYTDTFFAENYLVIFEEDLLGNMSLSREIAWIDNKGNILFNRVTDERYSRGDIVNVLIALSNSFKPKQFKIINQKVPIIAKPTPQLTPTPIPMPTTTIDFDCQILKAKGKKYTREIPTVISSRADLEKFYHSEYPNDPGNPIAANYFWEATELYTDTYFAENYLVIFTSGRFMSHTSQEVAWIDDNGNVVINWRGRKELGPEEHFHIVIALCNSFKPEQFKIIWQKVKDPLSYTPARILAPEIEKKMLDNFLLYQNHIAQNNREDLYIDWYFGRYSGCEVTVIGGIKDDAVYVYKDASFMLHADAYETGWITRADLIMIEKWRDVRVIVLSTKYVA